MERILGAIVFPARLSGSWKSRSGISLVWQTMARRPIKRKDPREEAPPMLKTLTRLHTPDLLHCLPQWVTATSSRSSTAISRRCRTRADWSGSTGRPSGRALGLAAADAARHFREGSGAEGKSPTPSIPFPRCRRSVSRSSTSGRADMRSSPASSGTPSTSGRARHSPSDRGATHLRLHHRQEGRGDGRLRRSVMARRPIVVMGVFVADLAFLAPKLPA